MGGFLVSEDRCPAFSVIIGRASTEDQGRILECLQALRQQEGVHSYEVIIADRRSDDISQAIQLDFPEARLFRCKGDVTLPELHTLALRQVRSNIIVVTEDHCVPAQSIYRLLYFG
jgi:hypothetical protein